MIRKAAKRVKADSENGARRAILEDLFYDFNSSKAQIFWINFWRGIFFGVGSVLGATLIVALVVWLLSLLVGLPGGIGDFIEYLRNTVQNRP